ncbi:MAG: hypothetical protein HKN43_13190 [Rhodothermales bacterium]|nr:hypothetical protein [Rhodothermales bacterium]
MLLISISAVTPNAVFSQAWNPPKGTAYVKFSYGHVTAADQYTFHGTTTDYIQGLPGDTYRDRSLYAYTEIGLTDNVSLVVSVPYKRTFVRDHAFRFRIFGFGTATVGGRFSLSPLLGLENSRNAVAANVTAFVPLGYTRNYTPSAGSGQLGVETSISFGHSFYPLPAYVQVATGYRLRSSQYFLSAAADCRIGSDIHCSSDSKPDFGDELVVRAETGISPFNGLVLVQLLSSLTWSLKEPMVGFSAINPVPTHQRYVKTGVGAAIYPFVLLHKPGLSSFGISAQYFITPYGRNSINSRDVFLGVELKPSF